MHPQLHQAIRNTSSQTLTCTIHVPKFINSRLQLEQYLKRSNSINKKKCLRSPSVVQWQWEPDCQQLWPAVRSLAAPQYWSRPSPTWFQNPRDLTFFAIENKHTPIMRKCHYLSHFPWTCFQTFPTSLWTPWLLHLLHRVTEQPRLEGAVVDLSWEKEPR